LEITLETLKPAGFIIEGAFSPKKIYKVQPIAEEEGLVLFLTNLYILECICFLAAA